MDALNVKAQRVPLPAFHVVSGTHLLRGDIEFKDKQAVEHLQLISDTRTTA